MVFNTYGYKIIPSYYNLDEDVIHMVKYTTV